MKKSKILVVVFLFTAFATLKAQIPGYVPLTSLLAWYPLNGNAGDASANGHNGVLNGPQPTTDRFGAPNSAYLYDGNDYISIVDNPVNFRPRDLTVSSWVLFNSFPAIHSIIISKNVNGTTSSESFDVNYRNNPPAWFCNTGNPSSTGVITTAPGTVATGSWYHVVYQFDDVNNIQTLYINGVLTASSVVNTSIGYDSGSWTLGMQLENGIMAYYLNGKLDDVGIWERVLSPCEISRLYAASVFSASASSSAICSGQTTTLTAIGATSYSWSNNSNAQSISVNPSSTTVYTVTGTYSNSPVCTATVQVDVTICTGLESSSPEQNLVKVYPNPMDSYLIIELPAGDSFDFQRSVTLLNLLGEVISYEERKQDCIQHEIRTDNFQKGIYFVKVMAGKNQQVFRIVKD